ETRSSAVVDGVLSLVVGPEALESPSSGALVEVGVLDHDIDSASITFKDDSALLLGLAQFIDDDRTVAEITGRVAFDRFGIREDVMHALFAFRERAAGKDHAGSYVNPAPEIVGVLDGFGGVGV